MPSNDPTDHNISGSARAGGTPQKSAGGEDVKMGPAPSTATSINLLFAFHSSREDAQWVLAEIEKRALERPKGSTVHLWLELMIPGQMPHEFKSYLSFLESNGLVSRKSFTASDLYAFTQPDRMTRSFRSALEALWAVQACGSREDATASYSMPVSMFADFMNSNNQVGQFDFPEFDLEMLRGFQALRARGVPFEVKMERPSFESYMAHIDSTLHAVLSTYHLDQGEKEAALRSLTSSVISKDYANYLRESKIAHDIFAYTTAHPGDEHILTYGAFHKDGLPKHFTELSLAPRVAVQKDLVYTSFLDDNSLINGVKFQEDGTISAPDRGRLIVAFMGYFLDPINPGGSNERKFVAVVSDLLRSLPNDALEEWFDQICVSSPGNLDVEKIGRATYTWLRAHTPEHLQSAVNEFGALEQRR